MRCFERNGHNERPMLWVKRQSSSVIWNVNANEDAKPLCLSVCVIYERPSEPYATMKLNWSLFILALIGSRINCPKNGKVIYAVAILHFVPPCSASKAAVSRNSHWIRNDPIDLPLFPFVSRNAMWIRAPMAEHAGPARNHSFVLVAQVRERFRADDLRVETIDFSWRMLRRDKNKFMYFWHLIEIPND